MLLFTQTFFTGARSEKSFIVYDITAKQVHFFSAKNKERKTFSFADFNFSCTQPPLAFNMNTSVKGNISNLFQRLDGVQNRKLIEQSAEESKTAVAISKESTEQAARSFPTNCKSF